MGSAQSSLMVMQVMFIFQAVIVGYYVLLFLKILSIRILKSLESENLDEVSDQRTPVEANIPQHIKMS